jgi:hypothetical protein
MRQELLSPLGGFQFSPLRDPAKSGFDCTSAPLVPASSSSTASAMDYVQQRLGAARERTPTGRAKLSSRWRSACAPAAERSDDRD